LQQPRFRQQGGALNIEVVLDKSLHDLVATRVDGNAERDSLIRVRPKKYC
jgi:hypothetical protein